MTRSILFRSRVSDRSRSGSASMMIRQRGSDWSHLRSYIDTDDIRDIAWNKAGGDGLSTRVREIQGDYHIITVIGTTPYDGFYRESPQESRAYIRDMMISTLHTSAQLAGYRHSEYDSLASLLQAKPKNAIILISGQEIISDMRLLAYHNDLIYVNITHPWESNPTDDMLFSGGTIDTKKYLQEYNKIQGLKKDILKKIHASYVHLSTTDDIVDSLNIFFKYRYTHAKSSR